MTLPGKPRVVEEPADRAPGRRRPGQPPPAAPGRPSEPPFSASTAGIPAADEAAGEARAPLRDLLNVSLGVALIMNFGFSLAFGVYEVIWSLFLQDLGASIEWVGLTFALFGLPMMLVSPFAGRLVDRSGPIRFAVAGGLVICIAGVVYGISSEPLVPSAMVPVEAVAEAFLLPALYALVAFGSPAGRSSTAQGIFGAVGTIGLIVATLSAGWLWELGRAWPFAFFVIGASDLPGPGSRPVPVPGRRGGRADGGRQYGGTRMTGNARTGQRAAGPRAAWRLAARPRCCWSRAA